MSIAANIKTLRARSGAGILDCKKALPGTFFTASSSCREYSDNALKV